MQSVGLHVGRTRAIQLLRHRAFRPCTTIFVDRWPRAPHHSINNQPLPALHFHRSLHSLPGVLVPPVVFGGLLLALWTWKCFMMVLFQNKIIYMPGLPPNARREKIEDYAGQCSGVGWREERIKTRDGVNIALCVASVESSPATSTSVAASPVYIVYFQGNASSLPPRLPFLSPVMRMLREAVSPVPVRYTMVCVSYRGYWTSKGRPSENGIALDATAALEWIVSEVRATKQTPKLGIPLVLWGQSIGSGVATSLAARAPFAKELTLRAIILETPFTSVRDMLAALYPQKWLPYRYLWPFLRNHLDSWTALGRVAMQHSETPPRIVILEAGKDELVPTSHAPALEKRCRDLGLGVERHVITGAFHTEVMARPAGRKAVSEAIKAVEVARQL